LVVWNGWGAALVVDSADAAVGI